MTSLERRRLRRRLSNSTARNRRRTRAAGKEPSDVDLIDSLGHVQRLVLSGFSLETAIAQAALMHPSPVIAAVHESLARGQPIDSACEQIVRDLESQRRTAPEDRDAILVVRVLAIADSIGGRVADHIESLVEILGERKYIRRERATQAATSSASMRLLSWLPLVCGLWIVQDSTEVRTFMFSSVAGWTCSMLGIALNLLGRIWLDRVVRSC